MKTSDHVRLWIGLLVLTVFMSPFLRRGDTMVAFVNAEVTTTVQVMGPKVGQGIVDKASGLFESPPVKVLTAFFAKGSVAPKRKEEISKEQGPGMRLIAEVADGYFRGVVLTIYLVCVRAMVMGVWVLALLPVLAAAVMDGLYQRAIGRFSFHLQAPAAFSLFSAVVVPMAMIPFVYMVAPLSISPIFVPMGVAIAAIPLSLMLRHSQPIFGKI